MGVRIAIAIFEGAEELDWVGPFEVFASWAQHWPDDQVEVVTVAETESVVRCSKGVQVIPDRTWDTVGPVDVVVYPGGMGTRRQIGDEGVYTRLRDLAAHTALMTTVCTGSLVYAGAGLLDGLPATTHWASLDRLAALGTDIEVRPDDRFVDAGPIVTAAGVSAGIDMALYLVARLHSTERAQQVRRVIQYDPAPPV